MEITKDHPIAYFCAEYGLKSSFPFYAGGLGILAGDTLKAAADAHLPTIGIGLLYRGELAGQVINAQGEAVDVNKDFDPLSAGMEHVYLDDQPLFIKVHLTELEVWVRCWKETISDDVVLYLLDTDTDQNELSQRDISHALYSGTEESILKQQLILGIGGVKLLHTLGIHPAIYHVNEGRPSFLHWQLIRLNMDMHGMGYEEASTDATAKTVYTNHTLVGAGNPTAPVELLKKYGQYYAAKMNISVDELIKPGIEGADNHFSTTRFALNTSRKASAVSQLHLEFSKKMWPEYNWVGITNGVHVPTWQADKIRDTGVSDDELWAAHMALKQELAQYAGQRTGYGFDPQKLVITWSRRITGYKQMGAIFQDIERLRAILKNNEMPAQLILAGKTHPGDSAAKEMVKKIISYLSHELAGCALFIPDYDIELAKRLVTGSDIWLNTPEFGKEACGTSGMKAAINGVLNMTVADGWAYEVDWADKGWTLDHANLSSSIYDTLQHQAIPMFYRKNERGFSPEWLGKMRASMKLVHQYSANRMLEEYQQFLYGE